MAGGLQQFVEALSNSGILSKPQVSVIRDHCSSHGGPADAKSLAQDLIKQGKLTTFQAQAILDGKEKALTFGQYLVHDRIGSGGMGVIFKAEHRRMKRVVAIKQITGEYSSTPEVVKRFCREVELAAKLIHTNIVTTFDAGECHGQLYMVMEYVDGNDLFAEIRQKGPLPYGLAVDYIQQAACGLGYAHNSGVIHRDIKPGNMLISKQGVVKVLDMGLARHQGERRKGPEALTVLGGIVGTPEYMAPEQAVSSKDCDHRADIYSLGCCLYRFLTCRLPYPGDNPIQIAIDHREKRIPSLKEVRSDVPEELEAVFFSMMAKRAEYRYQSMAEVVAALQELIDTRIVEPIERLGSSAFTNTPAFIPVARVASDTMPINELAKAHDQPNDADPSVGPIDGGPGGVTTGQGHAGAGAKQAREPGGTGGRLWMMIGGGVIAVLLGLVLILSLRSPNGNQGGNGANSDGNVTGNVDGADGGDVAVVPGTDSATAVPEGVSKLSPGNWYDLLPLVDTSLDTVAGKWHSQGGVLSSEGGQYSRISLPVSLAGDYRLRFKISRSEPNEASAVILPIGESQVYLMIAGWGNQLTGFGDIDGEHAGANVSTNNEFQMVPEKQYQVEIEVTTTGDQAAIKLAIDGRELIRWKGNRNQLEIIDAWRLSEGSSPGLGDYRTRTRFGDIHLRMLTGEAKLLR